MLINELKYKQNDVSKVTGTDVNYIAPSFLRLQKFYCMSSLASWYKNCTRPKLLVCHCVIMQWGHRGVVAC